MELTVQWDFIWIELYSPLVLSLCLSFSLYFIDRLEIGVCSLSVSLTDWVAVFGVFNLRFKLVSYLIDGGAFLHEALKEIESNHETFNDILFLLHNQNSLRTESNELINYDV